jgi:hypothetical protein
MAAGATGSNTVEFPIGTCQIHATLIVPYSHLTVQGISQRATTLQADLAVTPTVQFGTATTNVVFDALRTLSVTRDAGAIPANSIGVDLNNYAYMTVDDVEIWRNYTDISASDTPSLWVYLNRVNFADASYNYLTLNNTVGVGITNCQFGIIGETMAPTHIIVFSGITDTVGGSFDNFIPQSLPHSANVFAFVGFTGTTGVFTWDNIDVQIQTGALIYSDAATALINETTITNSRLTGSGNMFALNAATALKNATFSTNTIAFTSGLSLSHPQFVSFTGNPLINGVGTFTNGGTLTYTGNTVTTVQHFSGAYLSPSTRRGLLGTLPKDITCPTLDTERNRTL